MGSGFGLALEIASPDPKPNPNQALDGLAHESALSLDEVR